MIKVYLKYPRKVSDSQYYKSMMDNPPDGINYISDIKKIGIAESRTKFLLSKITKNVARKILFFFNFPIANAHTIREDVDKDVVHCAHCLAKNYNKPWVLDFEAMWQMWISGRDTKVGIKKVKDIISNDNCKKILTWTETAKDELIKRYPSLTDKVEVIGYGMNISTTERHRNNDDINLLFIGRYFYEKGGLHALEVMDMLCKKFDNVKATFISKVPNHILEEYKENTKITFHNYLKYEEIIEKIYPNSDILIYPAYSDSFGFVFAEAMSFGIPIITADGYAREDIIREGKTGFIIGKDRNINFREINEIEEENIKDMVNKASLLIRNKNLLNEMSIECKREVAVGKFSIKRRNEKLNTIYKDAALEER